MKLCHALQPLPAGRLPTRSAETDIDQPQADYFKAIASRMDPGSKIILCSAEPGWQYTKTNRKVVGEERIRRNHPFLKIEV